MKRLSKAAATVAFSALALAMAFASPVTAEVYTVTLTNGSTFETRYEPKEDLSNPGKLVLLTDTGNWIGLPVDVVASVTASTETQGFGLVIDSRTVFLGISANDLEEAEDGSTEADPMTRLLQYFEQRDAAESYTVPQFAEPGEAGGIPLGFTRTTTPPIGRSGVDYSRQPVPED